MEFSTLADLIKDWDNLPEYLKIAPDKKKGDNLYERTYTESLKRLFEIKNLRNIMRKFCVSHPKDQWTWSNFKLDFPEFIDENDIHEYDFNREVGLIERGVYEVYDPDLKTKNTEFTDTREDFDPNKPDADPVMIALYNAVISANGKTENVEQSVDDKYNGLYETARNVANGSSLNPHAFICGEAGVGKCVSYDTVIPIHVDNDIAEKLQNWLNLHSYPTNLSKIQIGQLFDFVKEKYNKSFEYNKLIDVPFKLQVLDEHDKWVNCSKLVKKQDALYETKFSNGITIKTAAKHIISFFPEQDLHKYTEKITVGDKLEYLNAFVIQNKKISDKEDVFGFQVDTNTHLYKDANGIVHHNTHTVEAGVKKGLTEWTPNKKHKHTPTLVEKSGSVGTSFTDLLIFFFQNRHEKLIILDDCDGFLVGPSQDIKNFMKVLLNTTLKPISTPRTIRVNANRQLEKENEMDESVVIQVDTSKLLEGKCSISNGTDSFEFKLNSLQEAAKIKHTFGFKKHLKEKKKYDLLHQIDKYIDSLNLFNESDTITDAEQEQIDEIEKAGEELGLSNEDVQSESEIPEAWIFDSNLVLISNLRMSDVEQAVISRCDRYELHLTIPEFFCRCEQILDDLTVGEYSSTDPDVIKWVKKEAFAMLKAVVLGADKFKNIHIPVNVHLDFRFVGNTVTNKLLARANRYARDNNIDLRDPKVRPDVELHVRDGFMRDLIRLLKGDEV